MIDFLKIIKRKNILSELQLFQVMNIYKIFQLNILQKSFTNWLTYQINALEPLVIINNKENYEVKDIFDIWNYWGKI